MRLANLKPETVKRLAAARAGEKKRRRLDLIARLQAKAEEQPDSIFPELLAEALQS